MNILESEKIRSFSIVERRHRLFQRHIGTRFDSERCWLTHMAKVSLICSKNLKSGQFLQLMRALKDA